MLQNHRKAAGMTQWNLARALRTNQSQISKLERSERRLDVVDCLRICRAICLDPGKSLRSVDFVRAARKCVGRNREAYCALLDDMATGSRIAPSTPRPAT